MNKNELLEQLYKPYKNCNKCPLANLGRTHVVFGDGNPNAELMIIGEAPGKEEDQENVPFIGRSGKLLTNILTELGVSRKNIFITNTVKCRPPLNRKPTPQESATCTSILLQHQINIIQPKVICTLGSTAIENLLRTKEPLSKLYEKIFYHNDIPIIPSYHPAYIIRNPSQKHLLFNSLQKALFLIQSHKK